MSQAQIDIEPALGGLRRMRLWTIQPREIWRRMERGDAVRVDPDHPKYGGKRIWQYDWLSAGLQRHRPGFDGSWPWWLYSKKPDLDRLRSSTLPGGREQARIELELRDDRCASFPAWMWETIHSGRYLARSREALDTWYRELRSALPEHGGVWPLPEPWRSRLESSWEQMFDRGIDTRCWYLDEWNRDRESDVHRLMGDASDEQVALRQVLRACDAVDVTLFAAAE